MARSFLIGILLASLCLLAGAAVASADDTIGAIGVNDLRSDGILVRNASYDGPGDLDLLQSSSTSLYRGRMRLECVDPAYAGTFDFTRPRCGGVSYDALIGALARRGITYLPVLINFGTGSNGSQRPVPPGDRDAPGAPSLSEFAAFATAAARRYGPGGTFWATCGCPARPIQAWQIWNEENNGWWWDGTVSADEYAAVFAATRAGLRSGDPQARAIVGGLTYDANGESSFIAPEQIISTLAASNANAFDAVAVHPYTDARGATGDQLATAARTYVDRVAAAIRQATGPASDGSPRQQVWITEMGWSDTDTSPDVIAQALAGFVDQLRNGGVRAADNVGPVLWYMLRDGAYKAGRDDQLGLRLTDAVGRDAGAKSAWSTFVSASQNGGSLPLPPALADTGPYVAPPAPAPAPAPAAAPPVAAAPAVALRPAPSPKPKFVGAPVAVRARALRRAVRVTITCAASAARCSGTVRLVAALPRHRSQAARVRATTIGARTVELAPGRTRSLRVAVHTRLRRGGRRTVQVVVPATDAAGRQVTASTSLRVRL